MILNVIRISAMPALRPTEPGFLRRTLFSCPQGVKEAVYNGMVHPLLECGSSVWDPHYDGLNGELEKVQNRSTRNCTFHEASMTGILAELNR